MGYVLIFFSSGILLLTTSSLHAVPKMEVRQTFERTSVVTGKELHGTLHLKNSGDETLIIRGVRSSCGCTTIRLKQRFIPPNSEIKLRFIVDTRGKLGLVEKTVTLHTNSPDSPHIETLHFHALPSRMEGAAVQAVFESPCAECHLDSGIGKSGKALYDAVCAMCHPDGKLQTKNPVALHTMISSGIFQAGMPAYGEYLTEKQVDSLTSFLTENQFTKQTP